MSTARQPEVNFFHSWRVVVCSTFQVSGFHKSKKQWQYEFNNVKEFLKRKASFPIDVRRSKKFLLKLPKSSFGLLSRKVAGWISGRAFFKTPEEILGPGRVCHPLINGSCEFLCKVGLISYQDFLTGERISLLVGYFVCQKKDVRNTVVYP